MKKKALFTVLTVIAAGWLAYSGFTLLNMLILIVMLGFCVASFYKW
ncbi:MAG: hypothetical protein LKI76_09525 [Megasphaera sp.]|jgi:type II secretory pathway pseudopilin PulG|nr:hypothetical protein [Megasphaera sp.]MCI1824157.1 hypothetical protein [Megasphaera sp.]